jgi:hypothetical protein
VASLARKSVRKKMQNEGATHEYKLLSVHKDIDKGTKSSSDYSILERRVVTENYIASF